MQIQILLYTFYYFASALLILQRFASVFLTCRVAGGEFSRLKEESLVF